MTGSKIHQASCLCGGVVLSIKSDLSDTSYCHCTQCRKQSGHHWASANVKKTAVEIDGESNLSDFRATEDVRRRFCKRCGTWLIWEREEEPHMSISLGCFDTPTEVRPSRNIFTETKGDYYDLP